MKKNKAYGDWKLMDCLQFLNNIQLSTKFDAPLEYILRLIFSSVLCKMMRWTRSNYGIHFFWNYPYEKFEAHFIYIDDSEPYETFKKQMLTLRNTGENFKLSPPPPFFYLYENEKLKVSGWQSHLKVLIPQKELGYPRDDQKKTLDNIIELFNNVRTKKRKDEKIQDLTKSFYSEITPPTNDALIIPFNFTDFKLGASILWNNNLHEPIPLWKEMEEDILLIGKTIEKTIVRILMNQYHIVAETYLPNYQKEDFNDVAILFADVRSFTTMTEIARNKGFITEFNRFMYDYFMRMADLIEKNYGRVEKLAGDSIMGVFGEYSDDSKIAVKNALNAAAGMYEKFQGLKTAFLEQEDIEDFSRNFNEPLYFDLGIGINYGKVFFGYFGQPGSRQYMGLGDHANFAQRLESEAARFDPVARRRRAPILLSRTVYKAIGGLLCHKDPKNKTVEEKDILLMLPLKGKSYEYPVYEFWPDIHELKDG